MSWGDAGPGSQETLDLPGLAFPFSHLSFCLAVSSLISTSSATLSAQGDTLQRPPPHPVAGFRNFWSLLCFSSLLGTGPLSVFIGLTSDFVALGGQSSLACTTRY